MLAQKHRLTRAMFEPLVKRGLFLRSAHFTVRFDLLGGKSAPKCAVVVSAKVASKANVRNLIKRRARSVCEQFIHMFPTGLRVAVFAQKGTNSLEHEMVQKELEPLIRAILEQKK